MGAFLLAVIVVPLVAIGACGGDEAAPATYTSSSTTTTDTPTGTGGSDPGIGLCLPNSCKSDLDCAECEDGRTTCIVAENRCVACDPNTGEGCPEGMECTPYGLCAPAGQTCPTDTRGEPTITCTVNADCLACSPMHQVCGPRGDCQACTETNTSHCSSADFCLDGKCSRKCPASCTRDDDCAHCGAPGSEAHACYQHACAECSDTYPCPADLECQNGRCVPGCGLPGPEPGTCMGDEDCIHCGDAQSDDDWVCKKAINEDRGHCTVQVGGCSDIGPNFGLLPDPWDQYTQSCSNDDDCQGAGILYNVGELIRDLVGSDEIDLGITEIEIQDAYVSYGMNVCAAIEIYDGADCGLCVPCEVDSDCKSIDLDDVLMDLFSGDPLAAIAASLLIDILFGDSWDHGLHFFCQPVAYGYGACLPCGNPLQPCGTGSGGSGSGDCSHDVCEVGGPLLTSCGSCEDTVCSDDPYCCDTEWDAYCIDEAEQWCGVDCSGGSGGCVHDECVEGVALNASCSACAQAVCALDSYCCDGAWDSYCVDEADQECGGCGSGSCAHDICVTGVALTASCDPCAQTVCNIDAYCCDTAWDATCVDEAGQYCGQCGGSGSGCAHDECDEGVALSASCSACASQVCNVDDYCCDTEWDSYCVDYADQYCGGCGGSSSCAHDECVAGVMLDASCSSCATAVCNDDPYCCNTEWDNTCIDGADALCGGICYGGSGCAHDECVEGVALNASCSACAQAVCAVDSFCCDDEWDVYCVDTAEQEADCNYCY
ncbi:MAG: hypothetical protein JRI55_28600 [Deltaproteobacteria bacterium]|nr:hypothetical protein [Deltaproteobacteria bacterium]